MEKPLIVMALESEGQGKIEQLGFDVLYCGVGKVNAAYFLTRYLLKSTEYQKNYPYVLNMGSAGSSVFPRGALVAANHFVQRDMDVTELGFELGQTPFEAYPPVISFPKRFSQLRHGLCGTGDSFLKTSCTMQSEIIDMEAYALAKVCMRESISFSCLKYITDSANQSAADDWKGNLKNTAEAFHDFLTAENNLYFLSQSLFSLKE